MRFLVPKKNKIVSLVDSVHSLELGSDFFSIHSSFVEFIIST